jgi:hypothetical protein
MKKINISVLVATARKVMKKILIPVRTEATEQ